MEPSLEDLEELVEFQLHPFEMPDTTWIGHDFVLGVWQDELGVEYVRRHAVTGRR